MTSLTPSAPFIFISPIISWPLRWKSTTISRVKLTVGCQEKAVEAVVVSWGEGLVRPCVHLAAHSVCHTFLIQTT